jgi:hypothetical protein
MTSAVGKLPVDGVGLLRAEFMILSALDLRPGALGLSGVRGAAGALGD